MFMVEITMMARRTRQWKMGLALATVVLASSAAATRGADAGSPLKFAFADKPGHTLVTPDVKYSREKGYGFEEGAQVRMNGGVLTANKPFFFSAVVPEGNYRVTLTVGSPTEATDLTVKAELRRLMVEKVHLDAGKNGQVRFTVNVRTPRYEGGQVRLKGTRETVDEAWAWDEKLTLELNGAHPNIQAIEIEKVDVPTVFILGDSTVCDQGKEPWNSWGQMFTRFFKEDVAVSNNAESGETVASSLGAHRFDKVYSLLKPGDYVLFQFGHNDMKDNKPGALDTYKANYKKIIETVKAKGATPVVISSMERKSGVEKSTLAGYPEAAEEVAKAGGAAFIDLHGMSQQLYKALGADLGKAFQDGTHHNNFGSYEISKLVLEGVRQNKLDLAKHIREDVGSFDPSKPDDPAQFAVPASPGFSNQRPLGD
jgi:lysophospholipase L1-like esterase